MNGQPNLEPSTTPLLIRIPRNNTSSKSSIPFWIPIVYRANWSQARRITCRSRVLGAVMGTILLCSFPLWVVYRDFHGLAAYERVMQRLLNCLSLAEFILNDMRASVLETAPPAQANDFDDLLSRLNTSLRQALIQKSDPYMKAFEANAESTFRLRVLPRESDLNTTVESVRFWLNSTGGNKIVTLGAQGLDPSDKPFPYLGRIRLIANDKQLAR